MQILHTWGNDFFRLAFRRDHEFLGPFHDGFITFSTSFSTGSWLFWPKLTQLSWFLTAFHEGPWLFSRFSDWVMSSRKFRNYSRWNMKLIDGSTHSTVTYFGWFSNGVMTFFARLYDGVNHGLLKISLLSWPKLRLDIFDLWPGFHTGSWLFPGFRTKS